MKTTFLLALTMPLFLLNTRTNAQANTKLSNLTSPTSINVNLLPNQTGKRDIGSGSKRWRNIYFDSFLYIRSVKFISTKGTGNVFVGDSSGVTIRNAAYNTALGHLALRSVTSGFNNVAIGASALQVDTSGYRNTAVGAGALVQNGFGSYNTAVGESSLAKNTTGNDNVAVGRSALTANVSGIDNTAVGSTALAYNTASYNTAVGNRSLLNNVYGSDNVAVGEFALGSNTNSYNTAVGMDAGSATRDAQNNTFVGYVAGGAYYSNGYNNVFLGANTRTTGNDQYNMIVIGQDVICPASNVAIMGNTYTASYRAYQNWSNISDGRFKRNIKEDVPGLSFINKLRPVTYQLDATALEKFLHKNVHDNTPLNAKAQEVQAKALKEKEQMHLTGFVAQEVEKAANELGYDFSGVDKARNENDVYALRYAEFTVPLVKSVQELSKQNDSLKSQIEDLQAELQQLKSYVLSNLPERPNTSASLQQNVPNPFNHSTTITYKLPSESSSGKIVVTDKNGKMLQQINVTGMNGSVSVSAAALASGAYQYSLYIAGRLIETKQMIIAK